MKREVHIVAIASAMIRLLIAVGLIASTCLTQAQTNIPLVSMGAVWKYLDSGVDQGTAWIAPAFNDSTWPGGPAQLGYGDGDEATVVGFGPDPINKYITTYFRHSSVVNDPSAFTNVQMRLLYEDGVVAYLNGTEVFRANMPPGAITSSTLAVTAVENEVFHPTVSPGLLVSGTNVLAVEIHQCAANSSDLSFELSVAANVGIPVPSMPPVVTVQPLSQTNVVGSTATFSVTAIGTPPLAYQWYFHRTAIAGATTATLILTNVPRTSAGIYEVRVSNAHGNAGAGATLIVYAPQTGPGSVDLSFPTRLGVSDPDSGPAVWDMVKQPDGKVIVCGSFSTVNGIARARLVRLLPTGELDLTFNPPADNVHTLALQPDGRIIAGGRFGEALNEGSLVRLNTDGTLDLTFAAPFEREICFVTDALVQPDGKIVVAGRLKCPGHSLTNRIVRLNSDGSPDTSFGTNVEADDSVTTLAMQTDGKILAGGAFRSFNGGLFHSGIVRINADRTVDESFRTAVEGGVCSIKLLSSGQLLVGGWFRAICQVTNTATGEVGDCVSCTNLVRLNADGTVDPSFNAMASEMQPNAIVVQADGRILIGGYGHVPGSMFFDYVTARLTPEGSLDPTFVMGSVNRCERVPVNALVVMDDGTILVGGEFCNYNGIPSAGLVRLNGDEMTAPTITQQPLSQTYTVGSTVTLTVAAMGTPPLGYQWYFDRAMIPGENAATLTLTNVQRTSAGTYEVRVSNAAGVVDAGATLSVYAPLTGPGSVDVCFPTVLGVPDPEFGPSVRDMVKQADGKVILCGTFTTVNGTPRVGLARLLPSGEVDPTFNPPAADVDTLALQADGKLLVGGRSGEDLNERPLARLNPDGTVDATFAPPFETDGGAVSEVIVQSDGKILVAGWLAAPGLPPTNRVVRLGPGGALDATFQSAVVDTVASDGYIRTLAVQGDGRILVAGRYGSINGDQRHYNLARLNADGSLDAGFQTAVEGYAVHCVRPLANGQLVVGGDMVGVCQIINGEMTNCIPCNNLVLLNPDGTSDTTFNAATEQMKVNVIEVQPDGRLIVGGFGHLPGNMFFDYVTARFNADGSLDQSFVRGSVLRCDGIAVNALALMDDGKVWVGGAFCNYNGIAAQGLVRLNGDQLAFACRLSATLCPRTGLPQVLFAGPAGAIVVIEATSDLKTWTPLMTVTNTLSGVQMCDPAASGWPKQFYRARLLE